jgi:HPt (histidine-containing phosphotransfer) domain-containing protein
MTYQQALTEIGVDTESTLNRFSGNSALMEKFIRGFATDKTTEALRTSIAAKDFSAIERDAHTLKGISGNLGFFRLFEQTSALVTALRGKRFEDAEKLYPAVLQTCDQILTILAKIS